jgi:hypothetical protein
VEVRSRIGGSERRRGSKMKVFRGMSNSAA